MEISKAKVSFRNPGAFMLQSLLHPFDHSRREQRQTPSLVPPCLPPHRGGGNVLFMACDESVAFSGGIDHQCHGARDNV
ncbi:hypothetical protein ACET3Z_015515 [Daucus carota]